MDTTILFTSLSLIFFLLALKFLIQSKKKHKNLPPSPPSIPIFGHLHLLKPLIHRIYLSLSKKYGPIISFRFGSRLVVVVSSSSIVKECFTENDIVLANRPPFINPKHIAYNHTTMGTTPYGDHWRNLRRIAANEIFASHRLTMSLNIRKDEIKRLLLKISNNSYRGFYKVELKSMFNDLTFNNIMRMVAGKRYFGDDVKSKEEAKQFKEIISEIFATSGAGNKADYLPILNWIGQKYEKKVKNLSQRMDAFLQGLINEHQSNKKANSNTMIDHMLSLRESQPEYYTDEIIKGLIQSMIVGGTDTSAITLEWAFSNLLNNPDVLKKVRTEIDIQIGQDHLIDEPDVSNLPYLQNIISETFRLYPPTPLLVPHYTSDDCKLGGYDVPRDTILLVNAWAIHRDPELWEDPTSFKPERFESKQVETNYKLMPFGLGRRACPGEGLARRVVGLALGSLIQCFEWERVSETKIDMTEGPGLFIPKVEPLEAMCKARPIMRKVVVEAA